MDHDPWGLPLQKFGTEMKAEDPMILGEMRIEQEEMEQGVPKNVAEADAEAVLIEVAEASGVSPGVAKIEAEKAIEDKNILEAAREGEVSNEQSEAALVTEEQESKVAGIEEMQAQLAEEERISAASIAKQDQLKAAMESMTGEAAPEPAVVGGVEGSVEGGVEGGVEAPEEIPMVTSVGPAGDFSAAAEEDVVGQPVATTDVEVRIHLLSFVCGACRLQLFVEHCGRAPHMVATHGICARRYDLLS